MQKKILFGKEAREKLRKGVNVIADAVSVTLGPSGKSVLIGGSHTENYNVYHLKTRVTKDGVSVSREVSLDDPAEHRGAMLIREASEKTMSLCGDGTTTTVVLARAIVNAGLDLIDGGANSVELKKGIDSAVEYVVEELKKMATPLKGDNERVRQVATIAANNDSVIGNLIAEAFKKIGDDGIIDIEESQKDETTVKITGGVKIDTGWLIPNFNTNQSKNECELSEPIILLYDKIINKISQIQKIVEYANKQNRSLFICCGDMEGEALAFLVINQQKQAIKACVVKCPGFGQSKVEAMEDLAVATGATYISDMKGITIDKMSMSNLGSAKKITISKDQTVIVEGKKDEKEFEDYTNNLRMNLAQADGDEKEKLEKRVAKLMGGIAVISVGGATETEMKEKKDRVDDSVRATKSAIAEGFVVGAGTAFLAIRAYKDGGELTDCEKGERTIYLSIIEPLLQICRNCGVDGNEIFKKIKQKVVYNYANNDSLKLIGYNAKTNKIEDLLEAGVIDPVKVLRYSLINAASVAGMILTSDCLIVDQF